MGRKYAKGKRAIAECQRSGQKMLYRDLVEDGHIPGLLVHPDWWEPKHPQEIPPRVDDPIALERPAPEISVPTGSGDPESPGDACATSPDTENYLPSTTLQNVTAGEYYVRVQTAVRFDIGECVFVQRDDDTWFVSKAASDSQTPTYSIPISTAYSGGAASAGNDVYVGESGEGVPVPPPEPEVQVLALTTQDGTSGRPVLFSGTALDSWTTSDFVGAGSIGDFPAIVYSPGLTQWAAGGTGGNNSLYSSVDDGDTWTERTPGHHGGATRLTRGAWNGTTYVMAARGGVDTSTDGTTWTRRSIAGETSTQFNDVCWDGTRFLLVGDGQAMYTSTDGITWSAAATLPTGFLGANVTAVMSNGTRWWIGDSNGALFYSDDSAANWSTTELSLGDPVTGIAYNGTTLVAVGDRFSFGVSSDSGDTYSSETLQLDADAVATDVIYETTLGAFIIVGNGNAADTAFIMTSTDASAWTIQVNGTQKKILSICGKTTRGRNIP